MLGFARPLPPLDPEKNPPTMLESAKAQESRRCGVETLQAKHHDSTSHGPPSPPNLEAKPRRKATRAPRPAPAPSGRKRIRRSAMPAHPAAASHHIEQHLGIDLHAAAAEAAHAAAKHLARIDQVLAAIVPRPLLAVAQRLVRLADLLEPFRCLFVIGVLVRVVDDGELAVRFLNLVPSVFVDAEDLVVVFPLRLFEFELRIANVFGDAGFIGVIFGDGFIFADGIVPIAGLAEGAGFGFTSFEVEWIEREGFGAVVNCRFVVFEL